MKYNTNSVIINFFPSSDQVGAPLQRCGHLGSHGDHTHTPSRSIHSVSGITVHHSIRPHGNTHLQTNMVAPHLSKNYLFYSKLYCGSSITCVCQTTMQCRCTESLLANWKSFLFWAIFQSLIHRLILHIWGVQRLSGSSSLIPRLISHSIYVTRVRLTHTWVTIVRLSHS